MVILTMSLFVSAPVDEAPAGAMDVIEAAGGGAGGCSGLRSKEMGALTAGLGVLIETGFF